MSTAVTPSPADKLMTQLEADLTLFTTIGSQVAGIISNPLGIFTVIATLIGEVPQAIADIKATIADFKAVV